MTVRDVLASLTESTGVPIDILDDDHALDLAALRERFASRVLGQPEAVDAMVDLVAMVKSGLCDPGKPFGVFLFVGPTGVGKTELARTLAEALFGNADRLLRLDMSEYASYDGFQRLLGVGDVPGTLTGPVRAQPFSVVLLDEIEKSHVNVFDLCLQIFDAGRLTDSHGWLVDFRRTIVVMTSNVGGVRSFAESVGFGGDRDDLARAEDTQRELRRAFRPEFLGRLDRIVHFNALDLDTAESIAQREVARVLKRSGLARRGLAIDVGPDVLSLLLDKGWSPQLGARPLKRAVERLVLLPVARRVAEGAVPEGAVLRLRVVGNSVRAELASAEVDASEPTFADVSELRGRVESLHEQATQRLAGLAGRAAERKREVMEQTRAPGFWDDRPRAVAALDRVHRLEGVLDAHGRLVAGLERARASVDRLREGDRRDRISARVDELGTEVQRVAHLLQCDDDRLLGDALIAVGLVDSRGAALGGVERMARMYEGFARGRGLECAVVSELVGGGTGGDVGGGGDVHEVVLHVSGGGAFGLLCGEAGQHHVVRERSDRGAEDRVRGDRDVVRVRVLPYPVNDGAAERGERFEVSARPTSAAGELLAKPAFDVTARDAGRHATVRLRCGGTREDALAAAATVLRAELAAATGRASGGAAADEQPVLRRRYVLGPAPMVRDPVVKRSSGNLDRVLRGALDGYLRLPVGDAARREG